MPIRRHLASLLITSALLTGCGFHLRGLQDVAELPFQNLYVKPTGDFELDQGIRRVLESRSGVTLSTDAKTAPYQLSGITEQHGKTLRSIDINGKAKEYLLNYAFSYQVQDASGQVIQDNTLTLSRTMSYSDNALLAKEQEEAQLYKDMRQDAIFQMLRQLGKLPVVPQAR
ncbi:LPS-assembly lipoprotein LptE [Leeia oryzae]|uniref:LPS-assembly lipoprotein LptE n=1 Tax=Leeia oryzae TaxID=356662 RepID=UPI00037B6180|nr:LPS assembly lipoprotein LptE [Leeia oryzae]